MAAARLSYRAPRQPPLPPMPAGQRQAAAANNPSRRQHPHPTRDSVSGGQRELPPVNPTDALNAITEKAPNVGPSLTDDTHMDPTDWGIDKDTKPERIATMLRDAGRVMQRMVGDPTLTPPDIYAEGQHLAHQYEASLKQKKTFDITADETLLLDAYYVLCPLDPEATKIPWMIERFNTWIHEAERNDDEDRKDAYLRHAKIGFFRARHEDTHKMKKFLHAIVAPELSLKDWPDKKEDRGFNWPTTGRLLTAYSDIPVFDADPEKYCQDALLFRVDVIDRIALTLLYDTELAKADPSDSTGLVGVGQGPEWVKAACTIYCGNGIKPPGPHRTKRPIFLKSGFTEFQPRMAAYAAVVLHSALDAERDFSMNPRRRRLFYLVLRLFEHDDKQVRDRLASFWKLKFETFLGTTAVDKKIQSYNPILNASDENIFSARLPLVMPESDDCTRAPEENTPAPDEDEDVDEPGDTDIDKPTEVSFVDFQRVFPNTKRKNPVLYYGGIIWMSSRKPAKRRRLYRMDAERHLAVLLKNGRFAWVHDENGSTGEGKMVRLDEIPWSHNEDGYGYSTAYAGNPEVPDDNPCAMSILLAEDIEPFEREVEEERKRLQAEEQEKITEEELMMDATHEALEVTDGTEMKKTARDEQVETETGNDQVETEPPPGQTARQRSKLARKAEKARAEKENIEEERAGGGQEESEINGATTSNHRLPSPPLSSSQPQAFSLFDSSSPKRSLPLDTEVPEKRAKLMLKVPLSRAGSRRTSKHAKGPRMETRQSQSRRV